MVKKTVVVFLGIALVACLVFVVREAGRPAAHETPESHSPSVPTENSPVSPRQSTRKSVTSGESATPSSEATVPGSDKSGIRRVEIPDNGPVPEEIVIDGKKFRLLGEHEIDPRQIELKHKGKAFTAKFPIPEEVKKRGQDVNPPAEKSKK